MALVGQDVDASTALMSTFHIDPLLMVFRTYSKMKMMKIMKHDEILPWLAKVVV